jgi:hypothetical protein
MGAIRLALQKRFEDHLRARRRTLAIPHVGSKATLHQADILSSLNEVSFF